ncbi:MAG: hypothetical protein LBH34_00660 [Prevotellaceae bacterium]|nr:hypothetical protein [Prevotellaceae bacterium]
MGRKSDPLSPLLKMGEVSHKGEVAGRLWHRARLRFLCWTFLVSSFGGLLLFTTPAIPDSCFSTYY